MHHTRRRRNIRIISATCSISTLALVGCSTGDDSDQSADAAENVSGTAQETFEVTTPVGSEIQVPAEPQDALGFYTTDIDILITLGVELAGTQPIRDDYSGFPEFFPQEALADMETFGNYPEYNLEAVAEAGPDFILNGLSYDEELDPELQKIAPAYSYNAFDGSDWRDSAAKAAEDLGREAQWQEWLDQYEARVADIRTSLDEEGLDPVVADIAYYEEQTIAQCRGVPCLVFADLGLRIDPLTNADENGLPSGEPETLSLEHLDQLDGIDVVFASQLPDQPVHLEDPDLEQNQLWRELGFVQNEKIYGYDTDMLFGSPSGQDAFLTVVEEALLG